MTEKEKYLCGHESKPIIMKNDVLGLAAWTEWRWTNGFDGDNSQCFSCWLKSTGRLSETDKTSETKNGHDCDSYDCKYIKTASSVGKVEDAVKIALVNSNHSSSSAPKSEPQLPDNIDWGHDPTKDLCSRCKHTKEMHQDNCEIINCGCMKFTVKLGESELCKHEMLAITGVDCIRKIRCHKCNKDWFSLQDFIEEIRQQSELKGFNEGIEETKKLIRYWNESHKAPNGDKKKL